MSDSVYAALNGSPLSMKNHNGRDNVYSRTRNAHPRVALACQRVNWLRSKYRIESQSNRYAALSTYGRLPVRSADSTEGRHCKLTVIAFNVTRVHGRIKVNCSERRCAARNAANWLCVLVAIIAKDLRDHSRIQ